MRKLHSEDGEGRPPHAFISYAHDDRPVADALALGLRSRGCKVWIDVGEMRVGDSLIERVAEEISDADVLIPIVSRHSVESSWCRKEISLAMTKEVNAQGRFGPPLVLPIRVGRVEMPPTLLDKLYLQATRKRPQEIVPKLWEDIRHHTDGAVAAASPAPSAAELAYRRGANLYGKGEVAAAKRELHEASQESHHAAALLLGTIQLDQEEFERAADELGFAAGSENEEVAVAAVVAYGRMIATHEFDDKADAVARTRGTLLSHRDPEEAERLWLTAASSDNRGAAWAWIGLGRLRADPPTREAVADAPGAEYAFDRAARSGHSESRACALFKLGRTRWQLGKEDEAIPVLDLGAASGDSEWAPRCAFELGRLHWAREEDENAGRRWYEAANSGHPQIAELAREAIENPSSTWRVR